MCFLNLALALTPEGKKLIPGLIANVLSQMNTNSDGFFISTPKFSIRELESEIFLYRLKKNFDK